MTAEPETEPRRVWWHLTLLLLVVLPFLPELAIYAITGLAKINGCIADQKDPCSVVGVKLGEGLSVTITAAVLIGDAFGRLGLAVVWLVMCYQVIIRGWAGSVARGVLALAVTVTFALLPYLAPYLAVVFLTDSGCRPSDSGGSCMMFGSDVRIAHSTDTLRWLSWFGIPIALCTAAVYAIVMVRRARTGRQPAQSP